MVCSIYALSLILPLLGAFTQSPAEGSWQDSDLPSSYLDSAAFWSLGTNLHDPITFFIFHPIYKTSAIWSIPNVILSSGSSQALKEHNCSCLGTSLLLNLGTHFCGWQFHRRESRRLSWTPSLCVMGSENLNSGPNIWTTSTLTAELTRQSDTFLFSKFHIEYHAVLILVLVWCKLWIQILGWIL